MSIVVTQQRKHKPVSKTLIRANYQRRLFFVGTGKKFLGYSFETETDVASGKTKDLSGSRYWNVPEDLRRWSPLREHLSGQHRGVVRSKTHDQFGRGDLGETHVPFVTVDEDRHDGTVLAQCHTADAVKTFDLLVREFGNLKWLVEINPQNGSIKFFGFKNGPIPLFEAKELGRQIFNRLRDEGIGGREVFPHNSPAVLLPMRIDKTTIVDTGVLPRCEGYRYAYLPGTTEKRRIYHSGYDIEAFARWFCHGGHADRQTIIDHLQTSCANLPDVLVEPPKEVRKTTPVRSSVPDQPWAKVNMKTRLPEEVRSIPDAFVRYRLIVQALARSFRRMPTVDEVLSHARTNSLFRGSWDDGLSKRSRRIKDIIPFVSQTFNAAKAGSGKSQRPELDELLNTWRGRTHKLPKYQAVTIYRRRYVDEYGNEVCTKGRNVKVRGLHVLTLMGILCHLIKRNDHDIPYESIVGWWSELAGEGKVPQFSKEYYLACRQVLVSLGWIKIDHTYCTGQSKKASVAYSTETVGTVWVYPRKEHTLSHYKGYCAIAGVIRRGEPQIVAMADSRPPP